MKKIFWLLVLIFTLYIVLIFTTPTLANGIGNLLGINGFNETVIKIKEKLDDFGTKVPTKDELKSYYSGAVDSVEKTKENIDNIRKKAEELQETYEDTKEKIDQAQEKFEEIKETVDKITKAGESITNTLSNTGTVN